ncbi:transposase, IS605 OrfB family [Ammonifex degensii KC4]|uniref:Transposase, IS605 OrfB family n=1 Tax=Ammonifex degensii (strain DSM 10501 / KC4) TaxID=429009 RepID=C9RC94_AMMDK|nr:IS200/IS605 family accessory protein TnpB-related protein [Ammonifex degensii]ACX51871.1 transposase, IS605 OrfB family [Ammonifex degensii KC4]
MITLQCLLEFQSEGDRRKVLDLMRRFSSAERYGYQRLLEGWTREELKKHLAQVFQVNTRYADDAILKASSILSSCRERGQNPTKVVFGGRGLFEKLEKKHLNGPRREELEREWKEKRQGNLYSRGDRTKQGNPNLRFVWIRGELYLRICVGERRWVYARVVRPAKREKDKWIGFVWDLHRADRTGEWFPYNVELKLRDGKVYALVSIDEGFPPTTVTLQDGVLAVDVNAYPFHLALAEVSPDGNLVGHERISLHELLSADRDKREYLAWQVAYQVVDLALQRSKAIAMEDLEKVPKGRRGDGFPKLRKTLQRWAYKSVLEKIEVLARRHGVEVIKVNPAYTSVIGKFKYAPQYLIDKDMAGALVIGRRALGFEEKLPEAYRCLLKDEEFLLYALAELEEKVKKLKRELKGEENEWRKKAIKAKLKATRGELKTLRAHLRALQSGESEPASRQPADRWKEPVRGRFLGWRIKAWRVLSAALTVPVLEKFSHVKGTVRDFSPLRVVLVLGDWERAVRRPVPVPGAGAAVQECS